MNKAAVYYTKSNLQVPAICNKLHKYYISYLNITLNCDWRGKRNGYVQWATVYFPYVLSLFLAQPYQIQSSAINLRFEAKQFPNKGTWLINYISQLSCRKFCYMKTLCNFDILTSVSWEVRKTVASGSKNYFLKSKCFRGYSLKNKIQLTRGNNFGISYCWVLITRLLRGKALYKQKGT